MLQASCPEILNASIRSSYIWPQLKVLSLKINMRLAHDPQEAEFAKWQLEVGCPQNTVESLIESIYPGICQLPHPPDHYFTEHYIPPACNQDVDELNDKILQEFPGQERVYHSADSIKED
jgi:hypothetical protein